MSLPSRVTFSGSDLSPYLPTTIIYIRPPPSAPSSSPRAPQMSDTYLLSVQDRSLNELQIWRLVCGWIQSQGNGCSRLCNRPQVNTALGKASHHKLTRRARGTATIHDTHKEDMEGNTMMTMTMPLTWCHRAHTHAIATTHPITQCAR